MIWKHKSEKKKQWQLVLLIAIPLVFIVGLGFAEEYPEIRPINPVPSMERLESIQLPPGAREGLIERVEEDFMVISDRQYRLASVVRYLVEYNGIEADPAEFKVSTYIGFQMNDQREITEMWLIK